MAHDVFVSVGKARTDDQEAFISALETVLREEGLNPRVLGRNEFSADQPLSAVTQLVRECPGTIVLAFGALRVVSGERNPRTDHAKPVSGIELPTAWPQIVGATANALDRPLLVICERGLAAEGILEPRHDWFVQWVELDPASVRATDFLGVLRSWKEKLAPVDATAAPAATPAPLEPEKMTIGDATKLLRLQDAWKLVAALAAAFATVWGAGYWVGAWVSEPANEAAKDTAAVEADAAAGTGGVEP